ncbi:MAG: efflux RND transporter periplasmic adaptor subunit [Planctomycetota bacterium]|nr:efflux RND transporter periplasmic adaptor subunit [Planctomycetota bacterium]
MRSLLRHDVSSSFSDLWYRVGPTRPRLATHARMTPQIFGDRRIYIVEDPAGGAFYRLSEHAYVFVGMLDGECTVDEAWIACCTQLGDDAPTQRECIDLLSRLQYFGLLSGDQPLANDMIERRMGEVAQRRRARRFGGGLSLTIPLINPDRLLDRIAYLLKPIFSKTGLVIYLLTVLIGLYHVFVNRAALGSQLNNLLEPSNLFWLSIVFIVIRAWHEFGHAAACKAMGGRCTEIGLMLVAFIFPFPYCDASSAWRFPEISKRVIVSAGGMLFETFAASIAAIIWANLSDDAAQARTLLFNVMVISGVTTLIFNANPLLRYDGYFILSDLTGIANLAQRSTELSRFVLLRKVFGVTNTNPPPVQSSGQFWLLSVYSLLATPYRILVTAGIVLALWTNDRYLTLGAVIALIGLAVWIVWPMLKSLGFLIGAPTLLGRRARAVGISAASAAVAAIILCLIPLPAPTYATGTLEPRTVEPLRAREDGFVEQVLVTEGQIVHPGDVILVIRNPQAATDLVRAAADLDKARSGSDSASQYGGAEQTVAEIRLIQATDALERARAKCESLTIRATTEGRICPQAGSTTRLADLAGSYLAKGTLVGSVASTDQMVVRCLVSDRDQAYIFGDRPIDSMPASFRVKGNAGVETLAKVARATPVASVEVEQTSLTSAAGGEVLLDPRDPKMKTSLAPQFVVELSPDVHRDVWQAGLRARVRFETPARPLAKTWWRWAQQYLADRIHS